MGSSSTGVILAVKASNGGLLERDGQPVWPIRNHSEQLALEQMVSTFEGEVQFVSDAKENPLAGSELVIGLGISSHEDAKLYAHLTFRSCLCINRIEELGTLPQADVIVTTFSYVNECLLDLLYDRFPMTSAPGLIFSYDDKDLRLQVLTRSASLRCSHGNFRHRRIDINTRVDYGSKVSPEYTILGAQAKASEFREALSCGSGLLTLSTHSDGIDAYLRDDLVLCPMKTAKNDWNPKTAPGCLVTGICHRCDRPMSQVLNDDVLLPPETVVAHVLIYCSCWGLYPSPGVHSADYALSRRLLQSFTVGALLTSWEINTQNISVTAGLFHNVASGMPLGKALAVHLSSEQSKNSYHKLCLIGDPSMRLSEYSSINPLPNIEKLTKPLEPSSKCMAGLSLLKLIVNQTNQSQVDEAGTWNEMMATINAYEEMLIMGVKYDVDLVTRFQREIVTHMAKRDTMISKYWTKFANDAEVLPDKAQCPVCDRRVISRKYKIRIPGASSRRETMCPSCGSIEDSPISRSISMSVKHDGLVVLDGQLPKSNWYARIVVERFFTSENKSWEWPCNSKGGPLQFFQVPESLPSMPFRISVIMVYEEAELTALGCLYRGKFNENDLASDLASHVKVKEIQLSRNENPEPVPDKIQLRIALGAGLINRYPFKTESRVTNRVSEYFDCPIENLMLVRGVDECIDHLCREFPDMRYVTVWPGFDAFPERIKLNNLDEIKIRLNTNFSLNRDDIKNIKSSDCVIVANPSNPTGKELSLEEKTLLESNAGKLLIDETYIHYTQHHFNKISFRKNTLIFRSFSKSFGLAGARLGIVFGSQQILDQMKQRQWYCNIGVLDLHALEAVLDSDLLRVAHVKNTIKERQRVLRSISKIGIKAYESAANFVLIEDKTSPRILEFLDTKGIRVKDTTQFGLKDHIRISIGLENENDYLIEALTEHANL